MPTNKKPILSVEEEALLIKNVLSEFDNEIGAYSERLLQLHWQHQAEVSHE